MIFANMHYDHMFGRPAAEMLGDGWAQRRAGGGPRRRSTPLSGTPSGRRRPFRAETRVRDRAGRVRLAALRGRPAPGRCGQVPRLHRLQRGHHRGPAGGRGAGAPRRRAHGGADGGRGDAPAGAEDGGGGPAHRRHRARLQQHAPGHHGRAGDGAAPGRGGPRRGGPCATSMRRGRQSSARPG